MPSSHLPLSFHVPYIHGFIYSCHPIFFSSFSFLCPCGIYCNTFRGRLFSSIRCTCPYQVNCFISISLIMVPSIAIFSHISPSRIFPVRDILMHLLGASISTDPILFLFLSVYLQVSSIHQYTSIRMLNKRAYLIKIICLGPLNEIVSQNQVHMAVTDWRVVSWDMKQCLLSYVPIRGSGYLTPHLDHLVTKLFSFAAALL
jgi:hypothetical protein